VAMVLSLSLCIKLLLLLLLVQGLLHLMHLLLLVLHQLLLLPVIKTDPAICFPAPQLP